MAHRYHPRSHPLDEIDGKDPILFDGCSDCYEKVDPLRQSRDVVRALWLKMLAVEFEDAGTLYRSDTEARACIRLYEIAVFLQRHFGMEPRDLEVMIKVV